MGVCLMKLDGWKSLAFPLTWRNPVELNPAHGVIWTNLLVASTYEMLSQFYTLQEIQGMDTTTFNPNVLLLMMDLFNNTHEEQTADVDVEDGRELETEIGPLVEQIGQILSMRVVVRVLIL